MKKLNIEIDSKVLKWVYHVSGKSRIWVFLLSVVRVTQGVCTIFYASFLRNVVDSASLGNKEVFFSYLFRFVILNLITVILLVFSRYLSEKAHVIAEKSFRMKFFSELLTRDYSQVSKTHSGDWMNRLTSDVSTIVTASTSIIPELLGMIVRMLSALVSLYIMIPYLIYILVPAAILLMIFSQLFRTRMKTFHKKVQHADGITRSFMQERIMSLVIIHSFSREESTIALAGENLDMLGREKIKRHIFTNACMSVISAAIISAQILGIGMCGWGIVTGALSYGTMSAVIYLINLLEAPLANFSRYISQYYAMIASAERLMEIESFPKDMSKKQLDEEEIRDFYNNEFSSFGLDEALFSYDEDRFVLKNLSLEFKKGDFIAFTGPSGCGKSTVFKILMALYKLDGGKAFIKSKSGKEIVLDSSWRGLFSYVPQGNMLISGTIREALSFGDKTLMRDDEKLWKALEIAAADFVRDLPDGLDSSLGEGGSGLSEGQMQRISIARAVLSSRPILLLDESTSALDADTEKKLLVNLRDMTDRTLIIITHREAALSFCDKVVEFAPAEDNKQ